MSSLRSVKWPLVLVAALGTQVFLLLADFIFVTYYAQLSVTGRDTTYYMQFARETAGAFVFCFAPASIYLIASWLCRRGAEAPYLHAASYIAGYYVLDYAVIASVARDEIGETLRLPFLLNALAMLVSALVAAWVVARRRPVPA
ncbi:MAG TPA: hypothetical protein VM692_04610 [Gammaproteobacteria bacterium]|nr:hypothetical protein [Gammaproteobacteria bacterium]